MRVADDNGFDLVKEIEEKHGGKMEWRTFSTWYADTDEVIRDAGVFLYVINDTFYYEDFERKPQIFGIEIKAAKNATPYVKFESSFKAEQIKDIYPVKKTRAKAYSQGYAKTLKKASLFTKVFSQVVTAVEFNDNSVKFFEVFGKDFQNQVQALKIKDK